MSSIKINQRRIPVRRGQSLLQALEAAGIFPEYQCRSGFCGACRAQLKSGQVYYTSSPLACREAHEVLLCCAYLDENQDIEIELTDELIIKQQP